MKSTLSACLLVALFACAQANDTEPTSTSVNALSAACAPAEGMPEDAWRCGEQRTVECAGGDDWAQDATIYVTDLAECDDELLAVSNQGPFTPGAHEIPVEVGTPEGGEPQLACTAHLTVVDTTPPSIEPRSLTLWPPNHKLNAIALADCASVTDACDAAPALQLLWVESDEPADALGDGSTEQDVAELGCDSVELRAERSGTGDGRVYTLGYSATDAAGNVALGTCSVVVPHNHGAAAVAGSASYRLEAPQSCNE